MVSIDSASEFAGQNMELASRFNERRDLDKRHVQETRNKKEEGWGAGTGDYFLPFSKEQPMVFPPRKDQSELIGTEIVLHKAMEKIVSERKSLGKSGPAVFLDLGGMWGESWLRLADKFRDQIASGEVVFVVSNIYLDPSVQETDSKYHAKPTIETVALFKDLVTYVNGDVSELKNTKIKLKSGQEISLDKNISLIHETMALLHTSIPEVDIPNLASMLDSDGVLMYSSDAMHSNVAERENYKEDINQGFKLAEVNLKNMGMKKLEVPNNGYKIYSASTHSVKYFSK